MIQGMNTNTARRYVTTVNKISVHADRIYALADILSMLAQLDEKTISIDPRSLGCVGKTILGEVIRITETLDDEFVSVPDVERELSRGPH